MMRTIGNIRLGALLLTCLLVFGMMPAARLHAAAPSDTPHSLGKTLKAGVKTVLNERTASGTRLGAVVRVYNGGSRSAVVPGYELRAVTANHVEYTLEASADNPRVVLPRETVELSYMTTVRRSDAFSVASISWVSVDEYVYPKKETKVLSVPAGSLEWRGHSTVFSDAARLKKWGTGFAIPTETDSLRYTPVQLWERQSPQGVASVLVLRVQNTGDRKEWLPDFTVTGKTARGGYYAAARAEQGEIGLDPQSSRYLHFVMTSPAKQTWKSFTIATPETFADPESVVAYEAGRLQIQAPPSGAAVPAVQNGYRLLDPIRIRSTLQPEMTADVDIALAELHRFERPGGGYQTAVAKFRLDNRSDAPVAIPAFDAEWTTADGVSYSGERMNVSQRQLMPGVGMMVYYAFTMPSGAGGDGKATITLLEGVGEGDGGSETFRLPIGAVKAELSAPPASRAAAMYPYDISVNAWWSSRGSGEFDLTLDLGIGRVPNVALDERTVRLRLEAADPSGRVFGSRYLSFTGPDRLVDGKQTIRLDEGGAKAGDAVEFRLYEVFATPSGDVERLVMTLR